MVGLTVGRERTGSLLGIICRVNSNCVRKSHRGTASISLAVTCDKAAFRFGRTSADNLRS